MGQSDWQSLASVRSLWWGWQSDGVPQPLLEQGTGVQAPGLFLPQQLPDGVEADGVMKGQRSLLLA